MRSTHPAPSESLPNSQRVSAASGASAQGAATKPTLAPTAAAQPAPAAPQPPLTTEPSASSLATLVSDPVPMPHAEPTSEEPAKEATAARAEEPKAEERAEELKEESAEEPSDHVDEALDASPPEPVPAQDQNKPDVPEQTAPPAETPPDIEPPAILLGEVSLSAVESFADLPRPTLAALRDAATMVELGAEEEASSTGVLLVLDGSAVVCATVSDAAARHLAVGAVASAIATRSDATRTRVVAITSAKLATWDRTTLDDILKSAPWAIEELAKSGDRLAAFAGSTMGPLGDLDEGSRMAAFERMTARTLKPRESFVAAGSELPGLTVVGSGALILTDGREFETGDVVLPEFALEGGEVPWDIAAGDDGAIVLSANRMGTVELFSVLPSLLELLRIV